MDLTVDLLTSESVHAEVLLCIMSTDFGDDSSSRVLFRVRTNRQTNRQTWLNAHDYAGGYTAGVGNFYVQIQGGPTKVVPTDVFACNI